MTYTEVIRCFYTKSLEKVYSSTDFAEIPSQVSRSKRQVGPCKAFKALPKTQGTSTVLRLSGNGWAPQLQPPEEIASVKAQSFRCVKSWLNPKFRMAMKKKCSLRKVIGTSKFDGFHHQCRRVSHDCAPFQHPHLVR